MWLTGASPGPELLSSSHCGPASQRGCSTARCEQGNSPWKGPCATGRRQLRRDGHAHAAFSACPRRRGLLVHGLRFPSKGLGDPLGPSGSVLEREYRKLAHTFRIPVLQCGSSLFPSRPHWQCRESFGSFFRLVALINSKDHMPTRVSNWSMHGPSSRHGGRKTECDTASWGIMFIPGALEGHPFSLN